MKKLLHFLLFLSCVSNAQIVNIPDANFKAKLLSADVTTSVASASYDYNTYDSMPTTFVKIDVNNDGEIQNSEIQSIQFLDVRNSGVSDMTGLAAFVNLKFLICSQNQLTNLDLSSNLALRELYCRGSGVTTLNVVSNLNLRVLFCDGNQIANLNVAQNVNLITLNADFNLLSQINVTQNIALQTLSVSNNQIANLNISQNLLLKVLSCSSNLLTNIDVTPHTQLTNLACNNNALNTLNVTQNINLKSLICSGIGLTNLNVSSNSNLEYLNVGYNNIATINLSQNTNLKYLSCESSHMNNLDLSNNLEIESLYCSFNDLTNLDLSHNIKLDVLYCQVNQLISLNIKNGKIESSVILMANPNLEFICVDEPQIIAVKELAGSNVNVNSYCSFTPGGNYNTITGAIIYDANANGCEVTDLPQRNIKIDINDGTNQGATFTNNSGNYKFYSDTGSFTITPNIENPAWFSVSPLTATIPFVNDNNNVVTQNFCITPNGIHPDLEVVIIPISPARPGFDAVYKIVYKNKGNQTLSGSINFQYNDANLDFVSSTTIPNSQATGNLVWNYANLMPFESRSVNVTFNVNSPTETPAVNIGDVFSFIAIGNPVLGDETTSDNTFQFNQIVVGAFDPNDKTCLEGNMVSPIKIGEYLHYNINFENTGTFQAENVVINDVIDIEKFDINTLQVIDASHPVTTRVSGGKTEFIFENINLGASQKGNVVFKIKTKSNLVIGNSVSNKANIYFDYNFPIETNTATTTFQALNNSSFIKDNSISIFPNPSNSIITIKCDTTIKSIELFDVQGRVLLTKMISENSEVLDISDKANGIYFLKITSDKGIKVEKLIKE